MADGEQSISTGAGSVLAAALVARRPTASPPGQGSELGAGARCREQGLQSLVFYTLYSPPSPRPKEKNLPVPVPKGRLILLFPTTGTTLPTVLPSSPVTVTSPTTHHTAPPRIPFLPVARSRSSPTFAEDISSPFLLPLPSSPSRLSPLASPSLLSLRRRRSYDARHLTTRHETRRFLRGRSHRPFCTSPFRSGPSRLRLRIYTRRYKATNSATKPDALTPAPLRLQSRPPSLCRSSAPVATRLVVGIDFSAFVG